MMDLFIHPILAPYFTMQGNCDNVFAFGKLQLSSCMIGKRLTCTKNLKKSNSMLIFFSFGFFLFIRYAPLDRERETSAFEDGRYRAPHESLANCKKGPASSSRCQKGFDESRRFRLRFSN